MGCHKAKVADEGIGNPTDSAFAPFVKFMGLVGVPLGDMNSKCKILFLFFHGFMMILQAASAIFVASSVLNSHMTDDSVAGIFRMVASILLGHFTGFYNYIWLLANRHRLRKFITRMEESETSLNGKSLRNLRRWSWICIVCATALFISRIAPAILNYKNFMNEYVALNHYFHAQSNFNIGAITFFVKNIVWSYVTLLSDTIAALYVILCLHVRASFKDVNFTNANSGTMDRTESLAIVQRRHRLCCQRIEKLDRIFAALTFVNIGMQCMNITVSIRLIGDFTLPTWIWIIKFHHGLGNLIHFLATVLAAASVNKEVTSTLKAIKLDSTSDNKLGKESFERKIDFQIYCTQFVIATPALTAWNFIALSRGFIFTVASMILTYSLIMYEK